MLSFVLSGLLALIFATGVLAGEKRIALVVGESAYREKPLATAANDAGLVAQTLQAAGFDVSGARDLDEEALRHAFRDFLDKAAASGPDTVAFIYLSGYGLQLEGENYLAPIDAVIKRDADIPIRSARISDYLKPLAALNLKASIVVLDAARANPFVLAGAPIAGGLALYEPGPNTLLAFNAAPGTIGPAEAGPYGVYARALAEMMREGGAPLNDVFDRLRLRVAEATKGAQIPWNSTKVAQPFVFFERTAEAPPAAVDRSLATKSIAQLGPREGYIAALERDTVQSYQDYLAAFPGDPSARRVRAYLAARREAISWRRARAIDTMNAYWSYLRRYPRGPHAYDARRRLTEIDAALEPPPDFEIVDMGIAPPPPDEIMFVDRPELIFDDPAFDFAPPPPPPVYFLPPPSAVFLALDPPFPAPEPYVLPMPAYVPIPAWVRPPAYIVPPPRNVIYENIHNTLVIDRSANSLIVRDPQGQVLSTGALTAIGAGAAGLAVGAALPSFVARRAAHGGPLPPGAALGPAGQGAAPGLPAPRRGGPHSVGSAPPIHGTAGRGAQSPANAASTTPPPGRPIGGRHGFVSGRSDPQSPPHERAAIRRRDPAPRFHQPPAIGESPFHRGAPPMGMGPPAFHRPAPAPAMAPAYHAPAHQPQAVRPAPAVHPMAVPHAPQAAGGSPQRHAPQQGKPQGK